jgi:hypothetical protein
VANLVVKAQNVLDSIVTVRQVSVCNLRISSQRIMQMHSPLWTDWMLAVSRDSAIKEIVESTGKP